MRKVVELDTVLGQYGARGSLWLAKRFAVTPEAINRYAREWGLKLGDTPTRVRIADLVAATGRSTPGLIQRAKQEGVLRYARNGKRRIATVPRKWAEAILEECNTVERLRAEGWQSTATLCARLPRPAQARSAILSGLGGQGRLKFLASAVGKWRQGSSLGPHASWWFSPLLADEIERAWKK